jgi:hypothetical protein
MEYSNASPVMREHRLCRLSRAWQKAETDLNTANATHVHRDIRSAGSSVSGKKMGHEDILIVSTARQPTCTGT